FTAAIFVVPAVALVFSSRLVPIAWLLTLSRVAETAVFAWLCVRRFPALRSITIATSHLRQLLVYGGWLTVTNMLMPLILNLDRFMIRPFSAVRAVPYYAVPADLMTRLSTLASSVVVPLFPAFSALNDDDERGRIGLLYTRSMKYVALSMACTSGLSIAF